MPTPAAQPWASPKVIIRNESRHLGLRTCCKCRRMCESPQRCQRCDRACYCNAECQKADWPTHKPECGALQLPPGHIDVLCRQAETLLVCHRRERPVASVLSLCGDDMACRMAPVVQRALGKETFDAIVKEQMDTWIEQVKQDIGHDPYKSDTYKKGFNPGAQTMTLQMQDPNIRHWVARSPEMRAELKQQVDALAASVRDFVSAQGSPLTLIRLAGWPAHLPGVLKLMQMQFTGVKVILSHADAMESKTYCLGWPYNGVNRREFLELAKRRAQI